MQREDGRPGSPRPQIKPGLRRVSRDAHTVQIGLTPDVGVVVAGLEAGEADLLDRFDGTRRLSELTAWAGAAGWTPPGSRPWCCRRDLFRSRIRMREKKARQPEG